MVFKSGTQRAMLRPIINIGCQAIFKLMFAVVSLKVVAFYVGPSGMAVVGQIQSFLQILSAGASSVTTSGVVKLIAENKYPKEKILQSSMLLLVFISLSFALVLLFAARFVSDFFLQSDWVGVVLLLPVAAFFIGLNNLFISFFNGCQKYSEYFWYSIIAAFCTTVTICILSFFYGRLGAVYSIALSPVFAGLCILFLPVRFRLPRLKLKTFDCEIIKILLSYSLMALGSVVVVYGVQIFLRDYITTVGSSSEAGVWYAATRLSDIYMGICSVLFSTLLLPKYSSQEGRALRGTVVQIVGITLVFVVLMIISVNQLGGVAVRLIYGDAFAVTAEILRLYVLGDALKCLSWVFLYVMIAKQHVRFYLGYEIISAILYLALCVFCYEFYGFESMAFGYPLQGVMSLLMVSIWFFISRHDTLSSKQNNEHDRI